MILEALYQLAIQEELVADPDFEVAPVAWLVRVGVLSLRYTARRSMFSTR